MINLIPPAAKKKIIVEYWLRVLSVWCMLLAAALVAAICIMLPPYVLINSQVSVYKASADEAARKIADYEEVSTMLVRASTQARMVIDESESELISEYLSTVESLEKPGIVLSEIRVARSATGFEPLFVAGVATDRQSLAAFRDRLLELETVSEVDLPLSNLAKDRDISFSLSAVLVNEETP